MGERKKLVLVDGNSLLNRAFYAMNIFTTKDGVPTNGIFGFVKLIFKIIDTVSPEYFAVAFDLHAPTFRHKMYDGYKATRSPMPEELAVQVPMLKEALRAMRICIVEKEGFEADDVIGTLSRKFPDTDILIYTGDRDSYQLVNEHVSVCFTKRGVTEIDLLSNENFYVKVGLTPLQIIEEKALMGDTSDNIPGVRGVGPKSAMELLRRYGTVEEIYRHLDELSASLKRRLEEGKAMADLSHTLATIDLNVPLDTALEDCTLTLPFPEAAREYFSRLEFRSLVDNEYFVQTKKISVDTVNCTDIGSFLALIPGIKEFSFCLEERACHIFSGKTEYIFPLRENFLQNGFFFGELLPVIEELFSGGRLAIVPDLKYLLHRFAEIGVGIGCRVEDVSLLRYLADSNLRLVSPSQFVKDYDLSDENSAYGLMLAYREAAEKTKGSAEEELYRNIELPLINVLFDMERAGVCVDTDKFPEFSEKFTRELAVLSEQIYTLAGVENFNINSPFQLSEVLFDKLGYDPKGAKRNSRGGYSTSADVLERLAEEHEIVRLILRYREIQKLQSTYIDGIRPLVTGGVIHTTYNQTMTTTGRLSSANPNLQNIPVKTDEGRELRKLFIARPGHVFVDADYSQIELRLLAHFSGCRKLMEAYRRGDDIHAATASLVFGVPISEVTPLQRRRAKSVNFGIIYGMSAFGLAKDIGTTQTEAQSYINRYFEANPEVKQYMDENVRFAKENGYVKTILGRKRYIPELKSPNFNQRSFGERAAMNMPLQGSAADIIKIAMLSVCKRLKQEGMRAMLVLQVHDELILDVPIEETEQAKKILKEEMEKAVELNVPLIAEVSVGKSWYDAK